MRRNTPYQLIYKEGTLIPQQNSRESNMELLRVISIVLILVIHADFYRIPYPVPRWFIVEGADAGVNCFILISGYFGIHPKWKSFSGLIFQILFFIGICNLFVISCLGGGKLLSFNVLNFNWFINSYIALYVFAPILNMFAEKATQQQFSVFLLLWALIEFFLGYTVDYLKFERGYSFQAFIFLYLLARYIRLYEGRVFSLSKYFDMCLYFFFTLITAVLMSIGESMGKGIGVQYFFRAYNSPLMIAASTFLMLFFTKLRLRNSLVNRIGKSAFAVFLLHAGLFSFYRELHQDFFIQNHWFTACALSCILIAVFFIISIIIDQLRIVIWNLVWKVTKVSYYRVKSVLDYYNLR